MERLQIDEQLRQIGMGFRPSSTRGPEKRKDMPLMKVPSLLYKVLGLIVGKAEVVGP